MAAPTILERPERWDEPFDPKMSDAIVDRLMGIAPFNQMDETKFHQRTPLRGILRNDARIVRYRNGEIIVRQGDYGTSAYMVLRGTTRVIFKSDNSVSLLGQQSKSKKGLFRTLGQFWNTGRPPEVFNAKKSGAASELSTRQEADQVHVFLQNVPRVMAEHKTEQMTTGAVFGEIGALSRIPRVATIFADSDETELLEIRWQGLRDLMKYDDALNQHIKDKYRENLKRATIRDKPPFNLLSDAQWGPVTKVVEFSTYGDYSWSGDYKAMVKAGQVNPEKEPVIASEGDYPQGMVLVLAGFARVCQKYGNSERTLKYIGAGQMFGFDEIAHNWRKKESPVNFQYSLRSIGYSHMMVVPTSVMEEIVLPSLRKDELPPLIEPVKDSVDGEPPAGQALAPRQKVGADILEFLTENRYFNGTATMVIDLERCTRCDDCVRACASTHDNNPRFLRHGPSIGRLMIANACMHCADPVCMIGCPTGAIHRESTGQVAINPVTCIGCKACYNNCPYEAIRMVEARDSGGELLADQQMKPIIKATKCDLCVENHGGPACRRACPHGALDRINLNDLNALSKWLKR